MNKSSKRVRTLAKLAVALSYVAAAHLDAALVAHYMFEEGSGNVFYDSALSDGTPTPDDSALHYGTAYVPGIVGAYALDMNGSVGTPSFSNQDMLNGAPGVTLAAWVRLRAFPTGSNISSVIFLSNASFHLNSRAVLDIDSSGRVEVGGRALDSETFRSRITTTPIAPGIWFHLAGVIDYANDSVTIYINGISQPLLAGSTNFTGTAASNTNSLAATIGSTDRTFEFLNGAVDDVRIYNSTLSASAVAALVPEPSTAILMLASTILLCRRSRKGSG